jgi:hypothetical protein
MEKGRADMEHRRFSRIAFHAPAELQVGETKLEGQVLDVSLKGALVEANGESSAERGAECTLAIRLGLGDTVVRMKGIVAHRAAGHFGIHCNEIDIESIEHLRRLVELNLGDDRLLQRELAALVADRE